MNEQKLRIFINDPSTESSVYQVLLDEFIRETDEKDPTYLAASMLAVHKLQRAWKVFDRFRGIERKKTMEGQNPGL